MKRIAILVSNATWCGSISLTQEIFLTAQLLAQKNSRSAPMVAEFVGLTNEPIATFSGITVTPDTTIANGIDYDAIYLPTLWKVNDQLLTDHAPAYPWLRQQYAQGALLLGSLTGVYLMAEAGLLDGCMATTHWHCGEDFRRRYPRVDLQPEQMITAQNRLYCSGGVNSSLDMAIHLIKIFCGPTVAQQCERHCMMGTRRSYQMMAIDVDHYKQHSDRQILSIQNWLERHYAEPIGIPEIAALFGISQRNLNRRFKTATGESPLQYIQHYRLEVAKELLQRGEQSIQQICFDVGYQSLTVFGRRFRQYAGASPSAYREEHATAVSNKR